MQNVIEFLSKAVVESTAIGVIVVDACVDDMPIIYVNRGFESMTGYAAQEVLGKNCRFLQGAYGDQPAVRSISEALHEQRPSTVTLKNFRKSGEEFFNHLQLMPIFDARGELTHYVGIQTDVTELHQHEHALLERNRELERTVQQRTAELQEFVGELQGELRIQKQLEAQLREVNALLETKVDERTEELRLALERQKALGEIRARFVMTVSHEFRTPLSGIALATGILKKYGSAFDQEERHEQLDNIREAVENLTNLLDEVMFISKADANKLEFMPKQLDVRHFCSEIIAQIQRIDDGKHRFTLESVESEIFIEADEKLLRSALTNLIGNAAKYSPDGSSVAVTMEAVDERVRIGIRDEGIGIPEADLQGLFEPFHRGGNAQHIQGTGLGLSIVKNAVTRHGGTIDVASTVNAGTTFTLLLPRSQSGIES
jgi:PAS domain S-box-containing protein